jgi:hypothetical protein
VRTATLVPPESVRAAYSLAREFHALRDAAEGRVKKEKRKERARMVPGGRRAGVRDRHSFCVREL